MTDKEKLDAIRAEILRLVKVRGYQRGMANDLLTFMDSLPNEPISKDLEEELFNYLDNHDLNIQDGGRIVFNNNGDTPNFLFDFRDIAKYFYELGLKTNKAK